jgi:hypothetical protein
MIIPIASGDTNENDPSIGSIDLCDTRSINRSAATPPSRQPYRAWPGRGSLLNTHYDKTHKSSHLRIRGWEGRAWLEVDPSLKIDFF